MGDNNIKYLAVLLICVSVILLSGCVPEDAFSPMDPDQTEQILVDIPSGSSVAAMGSLLESAGLIRQSDYFKTRVKELGVDSKLKAGKYAFSKSETMDEIISKIAEGQVYRDIVKVTIPEGYEIKQIVAVLVEAGLVEQESFYALMETKSFDFAFLKDIPEGPLRYEGFLFPATYTFERSVSEAAVLETMITKFDSVFSELSAQLDVAPSLSAYEIVTMASIVEREGRVRSELPLIAGVFYNRIEQGIKLESCATIQYALGERKEKLYNKDLEIESAYNTYKYPGLPVGPIAAPGEAALKAALFPEETDKLFFVLSNKGDGSHVFSKTYAEHLKAKNENE